MKIADILNNVTDFILHFSFDKIKDQTKIVVIIFATIVAAIILFGAVFALIPQF